jgi:hypothetical protein
MCSTHLYCISRVFARKWRGPTDWNHALAIVVQVLHQRLAQAVYLPLTTFGMISRQESILFLQPMHQIRQFLNNAFIAAEVFLLRQHQAEVEDELITIVSRGLHANRITENTKSVCAHLD